MTYLKLFLITILFTTALNAEYLRTIRVGAFLTEAEAKKELKKLQNFTKKHRNIIRLQKKWKFKTTYRKSGKYYSTLLEPMTNKVALQEVIDTLRIEYKDAYVTKLKRSQLVKKASPVIKKVVEKKVKPVPKKIEVKKVAVEEVVAKEREIENKVLLENLASEKKEDKPEVLKEIVPEVVKKVIPEAKVEKVKKEDVRPKPAPKKITEKVEKVKEVPEVVTITETTEESGIFGENVWKMLFLGTLLILVILQFLNKRKIKKLLKIQASDNKSIATLSEDLRHQKSFLTNAKTSMLSIIDFSYLLLEFEMTKIQKDYVKRIESSSENLLNIVNNTLDISKIKNGELKIENEEFNINQLFVHVVNAISLEAKYNHNKIIMKIEDDIPPYILGDYLRLGQILINLLGNSVKFTKHGEISVNVKKLYTYEHAVSLGFIITDTGIGMSPEQVDDILKMNSDNAEIGLGLSVSKKLIEMMDGDIKVYSTEDVGTTFTFNIKFDLKQ